MTVKTMGYWMDAAAAARDRGQSRLYVSWDEREEYRRLLAGPVKHPISCQGLPLVTWEEALEAAMRPRVSWVMRMRRRLAAWLVGGSEPNGRSYE